VFALSQGDGDEERASLTHVNANGEAHMVDVGDKAITGRVAVARALLQMQAATADAIRAGSLKKGDVLAVARVAGIMAAKRTADLIPLCHPLALDAAELRLDFVSAQELQIDAIMRTNGRTGVEMEALTAASVAALTVYDMAKSIDRSLAITFVGLMEKRGGKSGDYVRASL